MLCCVLQTSLPTPHAHVCLCARSYNVETGEVGIDVEASQPTTSGVAATTTPMGDGSDPDARTAYRARKAVEAKVDVRGKAFWHKLVSKWRRRRSEAMGLQPDPWHDAVRALFGHGAGEGGGAVVGRDIFPAIESTLHHVVQSLRVLSGFVHGCHYAAAGIDSNPLVAAASGATDTDFNDALGMDSAGSVSAFAGLASTGGDASAGLPVAQRQWLLRECRGVETMMAVLDVSVHVLCTVSGVTGRDRKLKPPPGVLCTTCGNILTALRTCPRGCAVPPREAPPTPEEAAFHTAEAGAARVWRAAQSVVVQSLQLMYGIVSGQRRACVVAATYLPQLLRLVCRGDRLFVPPEHWQGLGMVVAPHASRRVVQRLAAVVLRVREVVLLCSLLCVWRCVCGGGDGSLHVACWGFAGAAAV